MMGAQSMPARFPCWCRATYSWGGETKKDLGFIEGDLIEALNAGDGAWWMGRLRRDPRAIGLFPSNFVKVLEESFQPAPNSRNASPLNPTPPNGPSPSKSKTFRKPFTAYEKTGPRGVVESSKEDTLESDKEKPKKSKFRPYSSMKTAQPPTSTLKKQGGAALTQKDMEPRIPAPPPRRMHSRNPSRPPSPQYSVRAGASASPTPTPDYPPAPRGSVYRAASPQPGYRAISPAPSRPHSPLPTTYQDGSAYPQLLPASRQPSPSPYQQQYQVSRAPSPAPSCGYQDYRAPSPALYQNDDDMEEDSPPPPPPPAHRVAYQASRGPSVDMQSGYDPYARGGTQTPVQGSPGGNGSHMTPSPLRDAMNDVMSSLQDMSMYQDAGEIHQRDAPERPKTPGGIWSPDEFELVRTRSQIQSQRAQSSLGFAPRNFYAHDDGEGSLPSSRDGPPELSNYVSRMERQLRHQTSTIPHTAELPPQPPLKGTQFTPANGARRPETTSSNSSNESAPAKVLHSQQKHPSLKGRKSAYELGRTYTTKTNVTNSTESSSATQSSTSTQLTSRSIMSGYSAGGFSATSAGSLARRKFGLGSQRSQHRSMTAGNNKSINDLTSSSRSMAASESSCSGPSYHESHASHNQPVITPIADWTKDPMETAGVLGGLSAPKAKKSGFFRKMIDSAKTTARTGAATARSTISTTSRPASRAGSASPTKSLFVGNGPIAIAGGTTSRPGSSFGMSAAASMGLGGGGDWMQVRRDVNRSNSLSRREREERSERCQMLDLPALRPIDQLHEFADGDEGVDGLPVTEPTDFNTASLALVDKSTRFIQSVQPGITATALAHKHICRPYRSGGDVQRLRAIFTWVAERITWEEDYEGQLDTRRVISTKRGCSQEIAMLVREMCTAEGMYAEEVQGYLKSPGENLNLDTIAQPNHWWNAVIVDGEWRIMDCSLASPTNPRRGFYSSASSQTAESWYFLALPSEICYTHIPLLPEQQHMVPPVSHEILVTLPCACPAYFRNTVELSEFDTSMQHLENLEMAHIHLNVPEDVECIADTEARAFAQDADGDFFESGDVVKKRAFAQAEWVGGRKRFTVKAILPGEESSQGVLKIYAGKRGLMHSVKDNPHSLAVAIPLSHTGQNPPYDFHTRHPTPHAQRHDLYVVQPQCARLTLNNTFVFCVRQHPSSLSRFTPDTWGTSINSPNPYARPTSAMSMVSASMSQSGSEYSSNAGQPMTAAQQKPAKLAIQTPSQKIIRLTSKVEHTSRAGGIEDDGLTTSWETVIKIGEKGVWRGLVLADRSARWCVFAEWEAV
ncbi:hypothetical protein EJ03DRAFT_88103 [Teratosphaeria nubilosa]|uniref:SH3 domain-containing protein n=1 Tax=Teratosphaeria nubilosa TaxID=161662 RepID=A0A6G1LBH2_9PEZI|nr:hypothetical protein EJ03DRAFT_88103 [Teratosphaeria nubilosa]